MPHKRTSRRPARVSLSPLIDPVVSALVVIAPQCHGLDSLNPHARTSLQHHFTAVIAAADIVDVPVFVVSPGPGPRRHGLAGDVPSLLSHRHILTGTHATPWFNPEFVAKLAEEDRSTLVLAGFWLEHQILTTALHALADGFDVYIPVDITPARTGTSAPSSHARLVQAGATPVVTSQVIHEWCLEETDAPSRSALSPLLESYVGG